MTSVSSNLSLASVTFALCLAVAHSFSIHSHSHQSWKSSPSCNVALTPTIQPAMHPVPPSCPSVRPSLRNSPLFSTLPQDQDDNTSNNTGNPMFPKRVISATTGLSLSAFRTTLRTLTGVSISAIFKRIIGILPPWARYFVQPFLVMYYTPLTILRAFLGTTNTEKSEARASHEKLVEGWRDAVRAADAKIENWPVHIAEDGTIDVAAEDKGMVADAIVEAVEMKYAEKTKRGAVSPPPNETP